MKRTQPRSSGELILRRGDETLVLQRHDSALVLQDLRDMTSDDSHRTVRRLLHLGIGYFRQERYDMAFKAFKAVLKREASVEQALEGAAHCAYWLGRYPLARALFRRIPDRPASQPFANSRVRICERSPRFFDAGED